MSGTKIYGIVAAECQDKAGETLKIQGCDTSNLRYLNSEHESNVGSIIGSIDYHKKIYSIQDCKTPQERRCYEHARVPILFISGELADDEGHPEAVAAAALLRFKTKRPDAPLTLGLSVEGGIVEKTGPEEKTLNQTVATGGSFTVKPANPKCALFLENDLQKSEWSDEPPAAYFEALKRSGQLKSFREIPYVKLELQARKLKKSLEDYNHAFTSMKCHGCKTNHRFFKSTKEVPNGCPKCGKSFTMKDIWSALNR